MAVILSHVAFAVPLFPNNNPCHIFDSVPDVLGLLIVMLKEVRLLSQILHATFLRNLL